MQQDQGMKLSLPSMSYGSQDSNDGDFKRTGILKPGGCCNCQLKFCEA